MVGRRGRDSVKERHWRRLVRQWGKSGLSVREFCDWQSLSEASFYAWRRKLADRDAQARRVEKTPPQATPVGQFLPVRVLADDPAGLGLAPVVEVRLPSGVQLRIPAGFTRQTLADVITVLETRPC
jgi:hypothetical protein